MVAVEERDWLSRVREEGERMTDRQFTSVVRDRVLAGPLLKHEHGPGDEEPDPHALLVPLLERGSSGVLQLVRMRGRDLGELLENARVVGASLSD